MIAGMARADTSDPPYWVDIDDVIFSGDIETGQATAAGPQDDPLFIYRWRRTIEVSDISPKDTKDETCTSKISVTVYHVRERKQIDGNHDWEDDEDSEHLSAQHTQATGPTTVTIDPDNGDLLTTTSSPNIHEIDEGITIDIKVKTVDDKVVVYELKVSGHGIATSEDEFGATVEIDNTPVTP